MSLNRGNKWEMIKETQKPHIHSEKPWCLVMEGCSDLLCLLINIQIRVQICELFKANVSFSFFKPAHVLLVTNSNFPHFAKILFKYLKSSQIHVQGKH